jgi:hypothetical protein
MCLQDLRQLYSNEHRDSKRTLAGHKDYGTYRVMQVRVLEWAADVFAAFSRAVVAAFCVPSLWLPGFVLLRAVSTGPGTMAGHVSVWGGVCRPEMEWVCIRLWR